MDSPREGIALDLVTGAGGFIGGALVKKLLEEGKNVRAVDIKPIEKWYQVHTDTENLVFDLKVGMNCDIVARDVENVWNLAADMGGMGFIENHKADCMLSVLINTNLLDSAKNQELKDFFLVLLHAFILVINKGKHELFL
jgi:nucleoside-diphosphate-sugar epimerase